MSKARDIANTGTALGSVSPTELGYLDGVTSAVQTQINNVIPSQTGNSGKYLTTDGSTKSWGTVNQYSLPSQSGKAGKFLTTNGTAESWADAAKATEIFDLTTTREWLNTSFNAAGYYNMVLSSGTGSLYVYNSSNALIYEFELSTAAQINYIDVAFARIEAVASGNTDLSITPASPKITTNGGVLSLDSITGSGNYGVGTGTATGGTSGYAAGQLAYVIVVGGGGGAGGYYSSSPYIGGGNGGSGGVSNNNTPISLSGNYSITIGNGGNGGTYNDGGNGNATTAFGYTSNGGNGGLWGYPNNGSVPGNSGTPTIPTNTQIYKPVSYAKIGGGAGGNGAYGQYGNGGGAGKVLVLRWTP